jgi:hypothetical protein
LKALPQGEGYIAGAIVQTQHHARREAVKGAAADVIVKLITPQDGMQSLSQVASVLE